MAGAVAVTLPSPPGTRAPEVYFRTSAGPSAGGLQGFQRNSVRRGVLNGLAEWLDEDDSVYLYVPKGHGLDVRAPQPRCLGRLSERSARGLASPESEAMAGRLPSHRGWGRDVRPGTWQVHRRSLLDNSTLGIVGWGPSDYT